MFIVIEQADFLDLVKKMMEKNFKPGKDIGILFFNETTLKEILAGCIATISTHFETMGSTAATLYSGKPAN